MYPVGLTGSVQSIPKNLPRNEQIKRAASQFEAILLEQILKQANKKLFVEKEPGVGCGGEMYNDVISSVLAQKISGVGSLGLAQQISSQIKKRT